MGDSAIRLNIGCGRDIRKGYINCDSVLLDGVDKIVDLNKKLTFESDSIDEVLLLDVLEHVDNSINSLEEIHRILKSGGKLLMRVPYWNSWCAVADPTHKRGFHEFYFNYFDPNKAECKERHYYSKARFNIISVNPILYPFSPYLFISKPLEIKNNILKRIVFVTGNIISNVIIDLNIELQKVQGENDKK